jgi:UDP-3-O-[3-hydroxymyristoyl] glucosamine N-acyltransferase
VSGGEAGALRLAELAERVDGRVEGDGGRRVRALRTLADAGPDDLAPLFAPAYREAARTSRAGALLVPREHASLTRGLEGRDLLVVDHPQHAVARILGVLHPPRAFAPGVHPTAVVGEGCSLAPGVHVGPYAVIGDGSRLAGGAVVEALAVVGRGCVVGEGARLHPHAVLYDGTVLGPRAEIHSGAVVGGDGFGYATRGGVHHKVPQVGRAVLGEDVEVGANSTIDRGALGDTVIGPGSKIDNLVQVGHNVTTGRGVLLCGQSGIAGSTTLGDHVVLGGQAGAGDHRRVGDRAQVAASSAVLTDVAADTKVAGTPAIDIRAWRRQTALLRRLETMSRRLKAVEKALAATETADDEEEEPR